METWLSGPSVFRVNGIVRETLTSDSSVALPSDIIVGVAALAREALLAAAGTVHVAAVAVCGASLAAVVVMLMTPPRSPRDWGVGLINTVVSRIGGGSAVIEHFGIQFWVNAPFGLCAMGGLIFACGLPGWAIVRWEFNFIDRNPNASIDAIVRDVKDIL